MHREKNLEAKIRKLAAQVKESRIYLNVQDSVLEENIALRNRIRHLEEEIKTLKEMVERVTQG